MSQNKIKILIAFSMLVLVAVTYGAYLFSADTNNQATPSGVVSNQLNVGAQAPIDTCELYWTPNASLSSSQRLECEKAWSIPSENGYSRFSYYPTKLTLSGTYIKFLLDENDQTDSPDIQDLVTTTALHFLPNKDEFGKLPTSGYLPDDKQVNFRDSDTAEISFGVQNERYSSESSKLCTLSGRATIEISEIIIDNFEGGIPLSSRLEAQLDKIIEKGPYNIECN